MKTEDSPALVPPPEASAPAHAEFPVGRMLRFISIVAVILLTTNAFVCATVASFFDLPGWAAWQVIPGLVPLVFIGTTILGFRVAHPLLRLAYGFSAGWLGALNFAFFASIASWLVEGLGGLTSFTLQRQDIATVFFTLALLATIYGLVNAAWIRTTRITVRLPGLPEAWEGRSVALVTDVHLGNLSGPGFVRRIIARLRELAPDAVMISGDMFDGTPVELNRLAADWKGYAAPRGIYYVTGNHDEFAERRLYTDAVSRTGIRVLNNEMISVEGLQIIGVHDTEADDAGELRAILRGAQIDRRQASMLLAHRPVNLRVPEEEGISLQLSGHTHGGQIWPWTLLVSRIYGPFAHGLQRLGRLQVCTSYGTGTWGPPLRVGTKSEIVLLRLENDTAAQF